MAIKLNLNPLAHLLGPERSPHAPTLRRTYLEKIISCFDLFFGKSISQEMYNKGNEEYLFPRPGVLDYLTLGLAPLMEVGFWLGLGYWRSLKNEPKSIKTDLKRVMALALCGVSLILGAAFSLMKAFFAAAITLFAGLIVIPAVHGVSSFLIKKEMTEALLLQNNQGATLKTALDSEGLSFDTFVKLPQGVTAPPGLYACAPGQTPNFSTKPFFALTEASDLACLDAFAPGRTAESEYRERILDDLVESPTGTPR